ncbi:MAG: phosphopantetheine-binding protein, partial [Actinomycetota bacterium]|nr:phosphopantetheine-binding protein [Actinomycetota bacterium]
LLDSGKVDRASLRTLLTSRQASLGPRAEPQDELERRVAAVWSRVLGVVDLGVEDQFTDVGGDSLKAMLLRIALEDELGEPVGLAALLDAPTIRDFADHLRDTQ